MAFKLGIYNFLSSKQSFFWRIWFFWKICENVLGVLFVDHFLLFLCQHCLFQSLSFLYFKILFKIFLLNRRNIGWLDFLTFNFRNVNIFKKRMLHYIFVVAGASTQPLRLILDQQLLNQVLKFVTKINFIPFSVGENHFGSLNFLQEYVLVSIEKWRYSN